MDKKFESEVNKIEKLLDKVDNDLLRQGLKSDFTVFFKNMDKTFEIYNICLEELCGQFYLMDLAFHSRVVRKLFHNYKHQLHNIMKYQLTLQKELNLKYQQEKTLKQTIQKLEDDMKSMQAKPSDEPKKLQSTFNFADEEEQREKRLAEIRKNHDKMKADANLDQPHEQIDFNTMADVKLFLSKDFSKIDDLGKAREHLQQLAALLERERQKLQDLDPSSENYQFAMRQARADANLKKQAAGELGTQTEGHWILDEGKKEDPVLMARIANAESDVKKFQEEIEALKKSLDDSEAGRKNMEEMYNNQVKMTEQSERENEEFKADNQQLAAEIARLNALIEGKDAEITSNHAKMVELDEEAKNWHIRHDAFKEASDGEKAELQKRLDELEVVRKALEDELAALKDTYGQMLKGGDHADEQTKKYIAKLETDLAEAKKSLEKYKTSHEQLSKDNKSLKSRSEEQKSTIKQMEVTIEELNAKLNKATYIISRASEGDASILEDEEPNKDPANLNQSGDANRTDGFSKKSKGIKIDKNNKEVEEYLKSVSKPTVVKLFKYTQTMFDPVRSLIDVKDTLAEHKYTPQIVREAIDLLLKLLGYKGLDDLMKGASRSASKKKTVPGKPGQTTLQQTQEEDDFDYDGEDADSPEPEYHDPNLYPKIGGKKGVSKSPPRKEVSPYPQRDEDEFDRYATSKKIVPAKTQTKKYTDKHMKEEEKQFREAMPGPANDQNDYEVYLSKMKIEKELTMFRMYLNIKRRYFKDPAKFIKTFRHYFGKEPPKIHPENLSNIDSDEFLFSFPEFKEYYSSLMHIHDRCGEDCVHLQRWYKNFGINPATKDRKFIKMHNQVIDSLPKSIPRRESSLDKLVKKYYKYY